MYEGVVPTVTHFGRQWYACVHCSALVHSCQCGADHGREHWIDSGESRYCRTNPHQLHAVMGMERGSNG